MLKINDIIDVKIDGILKKCLVVSILERDNEQFAIYSVNDPEESKLYVSKIISVNGKTELEDTSDREILDYVLKLISQKVKSISLANKDTVKTSYENLPRKDDLITVGTFGNTRVTEKNMEDAINIMREWSEENK